MRLCDRSGALLECDPGTETTRNQEIRELGDNLARATATTASLLETVKVYVESSEPNTRVIYRTQVENNTVEVLRDVVREVPVERETRLVVLQSGEIEVKTETRN